MTRRDAASTRARILGHARRLFAQQSYVNVTVKGIADAAGVSPNLITRYFGGKDGLFLAATRVEDAAGVTAGSPAVDAVDGPLATLGPRLAASIVQRWFVDVPGEDPLLVLQRAAGERAEAAEALATHLDATLRHPVEHYLQDLGLPEHVARNRAAAIDAFVLGVSTRRRVLRAELGDPAALQQWLGYTIQRLAEG